MSCEHPQRVYNKYIGEYVWVTCGKCNTCKNAKAARYTDALERERLNHRYCFFVTLTYSDEELPKYHESFFSDYELSAESWIDNNVELVSNREYDKECIPFKDLYTKDFEMSIPDRNLFFTLYKTFGGIPYASMSDIQYFNKRLNKFFRDNATGKFKNFRYFVVSEFGSTTIRPHFHGIYYTDRPECARLFKDGVSVCWKHGITDCQYVEKSACSYVAQYVNKLFDLPLFYQKAPFAPRYLFSKHLGCKDFTDTFGTMSDDTTDLQTLFNNEVVTCCRRKGASSTSFMVSTLDKSTQNFLYPKCPFFKQISHSCRVELYNIGARFFQGTFEGFRQRVVNYIRRIYFDPAWNFRLLNTELSDFLLNVFYNDYMSEDEEKCNRAYGWLRRLYYTSRKVLRNACNMKVSLSTYVEKIENYYNKKELYLIGKMYDFQKKYVEAKECVSDDLVLMYPEFLHTNLKSSFGEFLTIFTPQDVISQRKDAAYFAFSNKKTHFKNAYLDSLQYKENYKLLYNSLKTFIYAKECNEITEAFAS